MAQIALWEFEDSSTAFDAIVTDGTAQDGTYEGGATASGGAARFDGLDDYVLIPADPAFQLPTGTLVVEFTPDTVHHGTILSRDSESRDDGGHFGLTVLSNGAIEARHQTLSGDTFFATPSGFYTAGDDIRVTHSWDSTGAGGQFKVENLTQGTTYTEAVPNTLTLDMGPNFNEPITIGASQARSSDNAADDLQDFYDGSVSYVSIFDTVEDPGGPTLPNTPTSGDDTLIGDAGDNTIDGGAGNDRIEGRAGNDSLLGGEGDDTILGEEGDDTLTGGAGADSIVGGDGVDQVNYADSSAGVNVDLGAGTASGGDAEGDTISGVEDVMGSAHGDTLTGDAGANVLSGGDGDDVISGGAGDDLILGGAGADTIDGGDGIDSAAYTDSDAGVTVNLGTGVAVGGAAEGDTLTSIENLEGSSFADDLTGDAGANVLYGHEGDDALSGGGGADTIDGGAGDDTLTGGAGDDLLTGGAGDDVFVIGDGSGADTLTDFDLGDTNGDGFTNDRLDVSGLTDADGNPVNAWDVVVTDTNGDGTGDAILTFPNGESVTLQGVTPSQVDSAPELYAMGVPCFTSGTMIETPEGPKPIETLRTGDLIVTVDGPALPVMWKGQTRVTEPMMQADPRLRPVRIKPRSDRSAGAIVVSQQHCMVMDHASERRFVRARHLAEETKTAHFAMGRTGVTYHHLLLPRHAVIVANGWLTESFFPGPEVLKVLAASARIELISALGGCAPTGTAGYGRRALPVIPRGELQRLRKQREVVLVAARALRARGASDRVPA